MQLFTDDDKADELCSDDDLLESRELFPVLLIAVACLIIPPLKKVSYEYSKPRSYNYCKRRSIAGLQL
jgi:hypothetical protein